MSTVVTRLPTGPLVAAQVTAAGALLATAYPTTWWPWGVLAGGVATGAATLLAGGTRSRARRRESSAPASGLRVGTVERGGLTVGVASDAGGWFAVAELAPRLDLRPETAAPPSLAAISRVLQEGRDLSAVQLVSHTIATTTTQLPPDAPMMASYRQLAAGESTVAHHVSWLCVRIDACDGAAVVARSGGDPAAPGRAVAAAILRAGRTLRLAGAACRVLDGRELTDALVLAGVGGLAGSGMTRVCYGVGGVPGSLAAAVASVPAAVTTLATTVAHGPRGLRARQLVAVVAPTREIDHCDEALRSGAHPSQLPVIRLDGRHASAAYAAGPTAAALPPSGGYAVAGAAARLDPLDVPWRTIPSGEAPELRVPAAAVGVLFGRDVDRNATVVRMFRPWPTELVVVGGRFTAQIIALRALAVGALVFVRTARYAEWTTLAHAAGCSDRLFVGVEPAQTGEPHRPTLVVDDLDPEGATTRAALRPWQARLTVVETLAAAGARRLAEAHLAALHRLAEDEAEVVAGALGMTGDTPHALTMLPDDMVALVGGGVNSYTWLDATRWERLVTGQRADT